jgi:hypothetical protein
MRCLSRSFLTVNEERDVEDDIDEEDEAWSSGY